MKKPPFKDKDLVYAATARCKVRSGAGLRAAWGVRRPDPGLLGLLRHPHSVQHSDRYPFVFYEIKGENQPSARGATTRPSDAA